MRPKKRLILKEPMTTPSSDADPFGKTRGFMKVLVDTQSDRILGFTMFGVGAGELMGTVQVAMIAGLPYTAMREASSLIPR